MDAEEPAAVSHARHRCGSKSQGRVQQATDRRGATRKLIAASTLRVRSSSSVEEVVLLVAAAAPRATQLPGGTLKTEDEAALADDRARLRPCSHTSFDPFITTHGT